MKSNSSDRVIRDKNKRQNGVELKDLSGFLMASTTCGEEAKGLVHIKPTLEIFLFSVEDAKDSALPNIALLIIFS